jgi:ABC-type multidrug transport system ATPase subunit
LYASMLGLSNSEIKKCYENIIKFSELQEFEKGNIDGFSDGMKMRLAFSIAIQVPADVYLLDETLNVGDEFFKKKCLKYFFEERRKGKTILIATHDLDLISNMCDKNIVLNKGKIQFFGGVSDSLILYIDSYVRSRNVIRNVNKNNNLISSSSKIRIADLKIKSSSGIEKTDFNMGDSIIFEIEYSASINKKDIMFGLAIHDDKNNLLTGPNTTLDKSPIDVFKGTGVVSYAVEKLSLLPGEYFVSVSISDYPGTNTYDYDDRKFRFKILDRGIKSYGGIIYLDGVWSHKKL